jgi:hypothetical protein
MATRQLPVLGGHPEQPLATIRNDAWWVGPGLTLFVLLSFLVYATWAMLQASHYYTAPYLSPLYEPLIFIKTGVEGGAPLEHSWFGEWPAFFPAIVPASPAFLILPFPGLFRLTCYYYRKAYYRAFSGSPPACAVVPATPSRPYRGETAFLLFQNLHRYAFYIALAFVVFLYQGAFRAFFKDGEFGVGVGSIVLLVNATLLASYTFGCHSFRHLIGGRDDCMSCGEPTLKYGAWKKASWLNARHMQFAWTSLFSVGLADVYVRLVSMGVIHDFNTWS